MLFDVAAQILTYKFRIKDATTAKRLDHMAGVVNFVWNFCNETSEKAWRRDRRWLTWIDMQRLTRGASKELGIASGTIEMIANRHALARGMAKRCRLRWRSSKRSLGWVPFKGENVRLVGDVVVYRKHRFKVWLSRELPSHIRGGCFVQDARHRWFLCLDCEAPVIYQTDARRSPVGIDLGLKEQVVCSTGEIHSRPNISRQHAEKLAALQRAGKKRQTAALHAKAANARRDWAHKVANQIVSSASHVVVGGVSATSLARRGRGFAKSVLDAGWFQFRAMLAYKARRLGVAFQEVSEAWSTVTCSACSVRSGPSGLSALGVREWECSGCGTLHQRDVNAARNILAFGLGR